MQTFLPYADFARSLAVLDPRRLGKQRVEAYQLVRAVTVGTGWSRHPAARMWSGHVNALKRYYNLAVEEWVRRGYRNSMKKMPVRGRVVMPPFVGDERFHAAHRSNLLRKDPVFYARWGWMEPPDLPYVWGRPAPGADQMLSKRPRKAASG
jgi:hypothetical protein